MSVSSLQVLEFKYLSHLSLSIYLYMWALISKSQWYLLSAPKILRGEQRSITSSSLFKMRCMCPLKWSISKFLELGFEKAKTLDKAFFGRANLLGGIENGRKTRCDWECIKCVNIYQFCKVEVVYTRLFVLFSQTYGHEQLTRVFEKLFGVIGISTNLGHNGRFACVLSMMHGDCRLDSNASIHFN